MKFADAWNAVTERWRALAGGEDNRRAIRTSMEDIIALPRLPPIGICLKTRDYGHPFQFGTLESHDILADEVVVKLAYHNGPAEHPDHWRGTRTEFLALWEVD